MAGGDTGWWGGWAKMVFNVVGSGTDANPYITCPRDVARLINIDYCRLPVAVQNEFYEFLEFGAGLQITAACAQNCVSPQAFDRAGVPLLSDMDPTNQILRFYITDSSDVGKRILVQGKDANGNTVYSQDGNVQVQGIFVNLASPFADAPLEFSEITGLQKDITTGVVRIYQVDQTTLGSELLSHMEPTEQVASYRRYFLGGLPRNCCATDPTTTTVQVTAMAKLEYIPVIADSDWLIIQSIPALKEEAMAIRYSEMDAPNAAALAKDRHKNAIRILNGQLVHYLGREKPAINFAPWGSARLARQGIGTMT